MATNEIQKDADVVTIVVDSAVVSGDLVAQGGLIGVAQTDYDAEGTPLKLNGAHKLPLAETTTVGAAVYAHEADGSALVADGTVVPLLDVTATTGTLIGHALEAVTVSSGTQNVTVRLAKA